MKPMLTAAVVIFAAAAFPARGQAGHDHGHGTAAATKTAATEVYSGEVKRVNKETSRVTIAHGPLKAFDMPPMTMGFGVKDPAQLARIKPGDKVNFVLEKAGENLVITRIEPAR